MVLEKEMNKFPQDSEPNEYRFIQPMWLDKVARGLTAGAVKHPGETWRMMAYMRRCTGEDRSGEQWEVIVNGWQV